MFQEPKMIISMIKTEAITDTTLGGESGGGTDY